LAAGLASPPGEAEAADADIDAMSWLAAGDAAGLAASAGAAEADAALGSALLVLFAAASRACMASAEDPCWLRATGLLSAVFTCAPQATSARMAGRSSPPISCPLSVMVEMNLLATCPLECLPRAVNRT